MLGNLISCSGIQVLGQLIHYPRTQVLGHLVYYPRKNVATLNFWLDETIDDLTLLPGGSFVVICRSDHSQGQHGGQLSGTSYTMFKVATFTDVTF